MNSIIATVYTADQIIQYSVVGLVLLAAFSWILWKMFRKNKKSTNSCCGCSLADSCKQKKNGNNKNI